ncbi:DNA topoisomerase 2-like [Ananas comosus]|uniref:DNA topoisomerase 2-like n=1 Tax=Ananas comosus TaxID=4615 RepID=A0A6P5GYA4_ANACO|nr:DNA topoisomerase 2-like [Ananas comosus]
MEIEGLVSQVEPEKEPSKGAAARKAPAAITHLSDEDGDDDQMPTILEGNDDDDDDDEFELLEEAAPKEKKPARGRKPADDKLKAAVGTRKRGPAQNKPALTQKLITQVLTPSEKAKIASPKKKVRKTRASPFNKKSGTLLGNRILSSSVSSEDSGGHASEGSPAEVVALVNRPKRNNIQRAVYIDSDSEGEEEQPITDDSDFAEDED